MKKKASASRKKTSAIARKKRSAVTPKKKPPVRAGAKKKAKPKKTATPKKKTTPKKKSAAPKRRGVTRSSPRPRAVELAPSLPSERPLTDEEREAMAKCAQTALAALGADGVPAMIVACIARFVDEVRAGLRPEPDNQDVRLGLGVLWGEQVRAQVGWRWVHLSYPNRFASYALVPDDRAFACFPLNRLGELLRAGPDAVNTAVALFDSIRVGTLPLRSENAYLVIG